MQLLNRYQNNGEGIPKHIIVINETRIRNFKPELKSQSMEWKGRGLLCATKFHCQPTEMKKSLAQEVRQKSDISEHRSKG